jgi:uncharacterized protein YndB with AHSA1/START domain
MPSTDRIEKQILLNAPRPRVWRALSNADEFGQWFRVRLHGAFVEGATVEGDVTYPGYEDHVVELEVVKLERERLFSYRWRPHRSRGAQAGQSTEPTLVEFRLQDAPGGTGGTLLTLCESGFDRLPAGKREEMFRRNDGGWTEQMKNIERHVAAS